MGIPLKQVLVSPFLIVLLAACSVESETVQNEVYSQDKSFSDEDKRIARALSLGDAGNVGTGTPQYQATLCLLALNSIEDRLLESGILTVEQQRAFSKARDLYGRRSKTGVSKDAQEKNLRDVEAAYPDAANRARFAIGCLRDLI